MVSGAVCACHCALLPTPTFCTVAVPAAAVLYGLLDLGDARVRRLDLEDRPALEVHAEVQPADQQRDDGDDQDAAGNRVPELLPADEIDRDVPAVQAAADVTEARHHASLELVVRGVRAAPGATGRVLRRGTPERHGARAPSRAGSRPDHLCPWPKNLVRASRVTIGLVNRNTTMTSMMVVRPSVNAKPLHVADREDVQQQGGQERDRVGDQDRPPGPFPAALHRAAQRAALAHLVAEAFEEHHERVGGDADGHDQARDAGQRQREALVLAEQDDAEVADQRRDGQAGDRHDAQAPVVQERVDDHQQQADRPGDQARVELVPAELRGDGGGVDGLERERQRPVLQLVDDLGGLRLPADVADLDAGRPGWPPGSARPRRRSRPARSRCCPAPGRWRWSWRPAGTCWPALRSACRTPWWPCR